MMVSQVKILEKIAKFTKITSGCKPAFLFFQINREPNTVESDQYSESVASTKLTRSLLVVPQPGRITYSFQCDLLRVFLLSVSVWMSSESGVNGFMLIMGVCLRRLAVWGFPDESTLLKTLTRCTVDTDATALALDSRL